MQINPNIFRGYDIRGLVEKDLSSDVYYHLGRAYATYLTQRRINTCPVGCDNRLDSGNYKKFFIDGLNQGGIDTYDLGLTMSQIIYFSSYFYLTQANAMITASHNPKEYNGLKLSAGYSESMNTEEIQKIRAIVDSGQYSKGAAQNQLINLFPAYLSDLTKYFSLAKPWKIVIDACNTGSGIFYPQIFKKLGCQIIEQNCQPDGSYPLGNPDPTNTDVLNRLSKRVIDEGADLGFGYDADGDRLAVVDHTGQVLGMDQVIALFSKDVLDSLPKSPIVFNNLCSKVVSDTIRANGGKPIMWKTGRSFIKSKASELRAPLAGELSGHIFFLDNYYGYDDAAFASLRLLTYLERTGESLHSAILTLPQYISSPEIKLGISDDLKFEFIQKTLKQDLLSILPLGNLNEIDGFRIDTEDSMVAVRASQNGPYLVIKFESKTTEKYQYLKLKLVAILKKYPEVDWISGTNTASLEN